MNTPEQKPRRVKSRRTLNGWVLEIDSASWVDLMTGLSIAIDTVDKNNLPAERDRTASLRALRSALSKG